MTDELVGRCDFKQYEHCGPHERIPDVGQRFPPFGCKNWHPDYEDDGVTPALIDLARAEQKLREAQAPINPLPTDRILQAYQEQLKSLVGKE